MAQEMTHSGCILALQCSIESDLHNGPSSSHSNLVSDEAYICLGLLRMISWWLPYLAKGPTPEFNNGLRSDIRKQIRLCTGLGAPAQNSQVTCTKHSCGVISLTSLGQPTIRLRRYGWNTSKEGSLRRKKKKKRKLK